MHNVRTHQVRKLVFDNYQRCPVFIAKCIQNSAAIDLSPGIHIALILYWMSIPSSLRIDFKVLVLTSIHGIQPLFIFKVLSPGVQTAVIILHFNQKTSLLTHSFYSFQFAAVQLEQFTRSCLTGRTIWKIRNPGQNIIPVKAIGPFRFGKKFTDLQITYRVCRRQWWKTSLEILFQKFLRKQQNNINSR